MEKLKIIKSADAIEYGNKMCSEANEKGWKVFIRLSCNKYFGMSFMRVLFVILFYSFTKTEMFA